MPAFQIVPINFSAQPAVKPAAKPRAKSDPFVLSPSQLETFGGCFRKGAFKYIYGYPDPPKDSTELGSAVHTLLENWLTKSEAPDGSTRAGAIAQHGLHLLPPPSSTLTVERHFTVSHENIQYQGFKDLTFFDPDGTPVIHDHKTTSSFQWAKNTDVLTTDNQANIYAYDELIRNPSASKVRLQWLYLLTGQQRQSRLYPATTDDRGRWQYDPLYLTRDHVLQHMANLVKPANEILAAKRTFLPIAKEARDEGLDPKTKISTTNFPYDNRACDSYGGCPYKDICCLSDSERAQAFLYFEDDNEKEDPKMADDFLAKLHARIAAQKAGVPAVPVATPITAPVVVDRTHSTAPPPPPAQTFREKMGLLVPPAFEGVLPPQDDDIPQAPPLPSAHRPTVPPQAPSAAEQIPVKRGRGRPRKDSVAPPVGILPAQVPSAPVIESNAGFTLCIDCHPVGASYIDFSVIFETVHSKMCEAYNVTHYKLGEPGSYGKAPGLLATALQAFFEANPLGSETTVCVNTRTPEGAEALNTLMTFAGHVYAS